MRILLDTDVLSHWLAGKLNEAQLARLAAVPPRSRFISAITLGEILYGFERSARHPHLRDVLETQLLPALTVLPFDDAAARRYAVLRCALERAGEPLDEADLRIAAIALADGLALVTGNEKHFGRIVGLEVHNWLR